MRFAAEHNGPVFLRVGRDEEYDVYVEEDCKLEVGGSNLLREGKDVLLIACGFMVRESLVAAEKLSEKGLSVGVLDQYSIKPIDGDRLYDIVKPYKAVVTVEEHFTAGGMGSAVLEALSMKPHPPVFLKGIDDEFPPIGPKFELREHIGLCAASIAKDAQTFLESVKQ